MVILIVVLGFVLAFFGLVAATELTRGVGMIGIGMGSIVAARIYQASRQHRELMATLRQREREAILS